MEDHKEVGVPRRSLSFNAAFINIEVMKRKHLKNTIQSIKCPSSAMQLVLDKKLYEPCKG